MNSNLNTNSVRSSMAIEKILSSSFSHTSKSRGISYFERNLVSPLTIEHGFGGEFKVIGTCHYNVSISYEETNGEFALSCTCPHFSDGNTCKHLWASVLEADDLGLFSETTFDMPNTESSLLEIVSNEHNEGKILFRFKNALPERPETALTM